MGVNARFFIQFQFIYMFFNAFFWIAFEQAGSSFTFLADQIVEGLLQVSEQARQDSVIRYLVDPDGSALSQQIFTSRTFERLAAEFWDPFLDAAYVNNKLSRDIPRSDVYLWLSNLALMLMRGIDEANDTNHQRSLLRNFVAPAFAAPDEP